MSVSRQSNWLGVPAVSSALGAMSMDLTISESAPGTGSMNGTGLLAVLFTKAGEWAQTTLAATYSNQKVSGTLSGLLDPAAVTGTFATADQMTLSGSFGAFGDATWNVVAVDPVAGQVTGRWAGTFGRGQSLDITVLQQGNRVLGVGTITIEIGSGLHTMNVVVSGSVTYPSFNFTISMLNPTFFSVTLLGKARDANTLVGVLGDNPASVELMRWTSG